MIEAQINSPEIHIKNELSLGHSVLRANALDGYSPVITGNYVSPNYELPLPYPDGDWYLRQTFVPAVRPGETVVCHSLIPGLREHYERIGLLSVDTNIIEVEPNPHISQYGFPGTDPLEILRGDVTFNDESGPNYLCSTFGGHQVDAQAEALGLHTIKRAESSQTNNKAVLRHASPEYGIEVLPGATVSDWSEVDSILNQSWNTKCGSWLKFPTGSGGDLVINIQGEVDMENFQTAVHQLRDSVEKAFEEGIFDVNFEDFWPKVDIAPQNYPLVLEADASLLGDVIVNGSTQFLSQKMGELCIVGHFKQITTSAGEYLGNEPYPDMDPEVQEMAERQSETVAEYNAYANGYFGIAAIDWFLTETGGEKKLSVVELNSRPTANTPPVIIAQKLGARHFINTNVYTNHAIYNIGDFLNEIGSELAFGNPNTNGLVVPQAFRTLVTRGKTVASPNFKVAIFGKNSEHCHSIAETLEKKGLRFEP